MTARTEPYPRRCAALIVLAFSLLVIRRRTLLLGLGTFGLGAALASSRLVPPS